MTPHRTGRHLVGVRPAVPGGAVGRAEPVSACIADAVLLVRQGGQHDALDVATATLTPYAGIERRLAAEGIVLTTLADEQHRIGDAC